MILWDLREFGNSFQTRERVGVGGERDFGETRKARDPLVSGSGRHLEKWKEGQLCGCRQWL